MRPVALLAAFTCVLAMSTASAAQHVHFAEQQLPISVELTRLLESPIVYMNMRVKFQCVYIECGNLYDPLHTQFSSERYVNMVVWDSGARIWEPTVRAKPIVGLYFEKERAPDSVLGSLKKYQLIEVTGEVCSAFRDRPWIDIHTISLVDRAGSFTDNAVYHIEQAVALGNEGTRDLADQHYVGALKEDLPLRGRIMVSELQARNLMAGAKFAESAVVLSKALALAEPEKKDPTVEPKLRADLHYLLAKALGEIAQSTSAKTDRTARFKDAAIHARTALDLDPTQGDTYAVLGISLAGLSEYDEARRQCAIAIRLQPNNAEIRWYLGRILDLQGQYDEAIEALKKAIDLTPKDYRNHKAIASAYFHRSQKGGPNAASDLVTGLKEDDIAIRLNPSDPEIYYSSGQVLESATDKKIEIQIGTAKQMATYALAIERYQAALTADPKFLDAHLALAKRYQADNRPDDAIKHLKAALDLQPKDIERYQILGDYQLSLARKEDAYNTYESYLKVDADNAAMLAMVGHVALEAGKVQGGIAALTKLLKAQPKLVQPNIDLAELYLAVNNPKDAISRASAALEYATTPEDKAKAQSVLGKAQAAAGEKAKPAAPKPAPAPAAAKPATPAPAPAAPKK